MPRTRIKICGITRPEDARAAAELGADAIGLVFYPPSSRYVSLEQARAICDALPPLVSVVGLFVNAERKHILEAMAALPLGWLQFHGDESPDFCAGFDRPFFRALRIAGPETVQDAFQRWQGSAGLLLDAHVKGQYGGTGKTFNWGWIPDQRPLPVILAGGLTSANVAGAVRQVRPWAVDVSGGVEQVGGVKDPERIRQFINEVRGVDQAD